MKIVYNNSPNHYNGRNGWKADMFVFHQTGGSEIGPAMRWYMNPQSQCSPNYLIDVDGTVHQMVNPDNAAYCNGTRTDPNAKLYYGLATSRLVKARKTNANFYTYSMEFVHCQWGNINDAQVHAAVELIRDILIPHMKKNGITPKIDREHFIGHCEIDPITRAACPGKQFPYDKIIAGVLGIIDTTPKTPKIPTTPKTPTVTTNITVNSKVKILSTATTYAGVSTRIPTAYKGDKLTYTVMKVSGNRALIKELYSWVWLKDLKKV